MPVAEALFGVVPCTSGQIRIRGEHVSIDTEQDIELIAIARRAVEMDFEALQLIERGV